MKREMYPKNYCTTKYYANIDFMAQTQQTNNNINNNKNIFFKASIL